MHIWFRENYFYVIFSSRPQIMVYWEIDTEIYMSQYVRVG